MAGDGEREELPSFRPGPSAAPGHAGRIIRRYDIPGHALNSRLCRVPGVIEYTAHTAADNGTEESSEVFCLVINLLDVEEYPALDLACCYPGTLGCETVIGHHKTDMGEG